MVRTSLPRPTRLALRLLAVSGVALATANCATNPQQRLASGSSLDAKYGVKASPRLYSEGDVIPKGGGRRFTGKPYVVAGQTYTPREDARGYVREGLASWYGAAFHGRQTANGEVFDRHSIAAAHPTLPLPSYARVTNLENGHSMVVRVNDRGPYHAGRVMDVSEEAAEALGFHRRGTARVRVEYVGKASVAGSDDRKLLATLRTDGQPAGLRAPVMMADLGPAEEPERFARSPAPLAFRPERAEPEPPAPQPEPARAPVVLAGAAMAVPAAVQPTAVREREFRPAPVRTAPPGAARVALAGLNPAAAPIRAAAGAAPGRVPAPPAAQLDARPAAHLAAGPAHPAAPMHLAAARPGPTPAAMPASARMAMARLTAEAAPRAGARTGPKAGTVAKEAPQQVAARGQARHARLAEIY